MILWLTGQTGSGKTTLGRRLAAVKNAVLLDGDEVRGVWPGLGLSHTDRWEQNLRVARLAKLLESQGLTVVVSVIAPYKDLRREIQSICGCLFIHVDHNEHERDDSRPYEKPTENEAVITVRR